MVYDFGVEVRRQVVRKIKTLTLVLTEGLQYIHLG